ncbi:MAG: hypothetical protein FRX49_02805 [Trebouxia sp. A1-2]|nr:MAG: hypothetical protein FRX49_02805 [Trebouxia sp. A1-2]
MGDAGCGRPPGTKGRAVARRMLLPLLGALPNEEAGDRPEAGGLMEGRWFGMTEYGMPFSALFSGMEKLGGMPLEDAMAGGSWLVALKVKAGPFAAEGRSADGAGSLGDPDWAWGASGQWRSCETLAAGSTTSAAACDAKCVEAEGKVPVVAVASRGKGLVGLLSAGSSVGFTAAGLASAAAASLVTNGVAQGALGGSAAISMRPSAPLLALTVLLALGWRVAGKGRLASLLGCPLSMRRLRPMSLLKRRRPNLSWSERSVLPSLWGRPPCLGNLSCPSALEPLLSIPSLLSRLPLR